MNAVHAHGMITVASSASVFVIGSPRSGTSALAWALAQHPELATGPEADFPYYLSRSRDLEGAWQKAAAREDGWLAKNGVDRQEFLAWIGLGVDQLFRSRTGGRRWVDSTPANVLAVESLAELFPHARFVNLVRDGRAVVSSLINSGFAVKAAQDFDCACRTWDLYVREGLAAEASRAERVLGVRHEAMVADPEGFMEQIQRFLELEPSPAPATFLRANRVNSSWGNRSLEDVRKPKPASVIPTSPWREWTPAKKATFRAIATKTMARLGYDTSLE